METPMTMKDPTRIRQIISGCTSLRSGGVLGAGAMTGLTALLPIREKRLAGETPVGTTIPARCALITAEEAAHEAIAASSRMACSSVGFTQRGIELRRVKMGRTVRERFVSLLILLANLGFYLFILMCLLRKIWLLR